MQTPTIETLRELTAAVNARVAEEYELFDLPVEPPKLSPGIVRVAWEVMAERIEVALETESLRRDVTYEEAITTYEHLTEGAAVNVAINSGNGTDATHNSGEILAATSDERIKQRFGAISDELKQIPQPEPVANNAEPTTTKPVKPVAPEVKSQVDGNSTAPAPAKTPALAARNARKPTYDDVIKELKRMAMGNVMPTMTVWDEARPADWPKAQALCWRFNCGWVDLAQDAGLKLKNNRK